MYLLIKVFDKLPWYVRYQNKYLSQLGYQPFISKIASNFALLTKNR